MTRRLDCVDWMKCLGMGLIVLGHVDGGRFADATPPIYFKQLGVACFLFIAGFSLARERRGAVEAVFRRLFEIFLFGIGFAVLLSVVGVVRAGDLRESNYLPFLLGCNVLMDAFPANPTTWFIGTYTHVILVWAIALRRLRIRPWMYVPCVLAEVATRAWLMVNAGPFVAYMALPNWMTVFLMGLFLGQQTSEAGNDRPPGYRPWADVALLGAIVLLWPMAAFTLMRYDRTFPFMIVTIPKLPLAQATILVSLMVSLIYATYTLAIFRVIRWVPAPAAVRFFARNTPIIFIVHMPLLWNLLPILIKRIPANSDLRVAVRFLVCFVLLAWVSELIHRVVRPKRWRDLTWAVISGYGARPNASNTPAAGMSLESRPCQVQAPTTISERA